MILGLLASLTLIAAAAPAPQTLNPGRRLYNRVVTSGMRISSKLGVDDDLPAGRQYRLKSGVGNQIYASDDAGAPLCKTTITNGSKKVKEAEAMGLPIPHALFDRGCTGTLKTTTPRWLGRREHPQLTQKQLDILYMLVSDVVFGS